jgi:hypothetical protein
VRSRNDDPVLLRAAGNQTVQRLCNGAPGAPVLHTRCGLSATSSTPQPAPEEPGPAQRTETGSGGAACVTHAEIPKDHWGVQALQGVAHDHFLVHIDWADLGPYCRCTCGEYRQYVKGHVIVNGRRVSKRLFRGAQLEDGRYHEDADEHGRPFGHRTGYENQSDDQFLAAGGTREDRENGCTYRARDMPSIEAPPGSHVDMHLCFKGQTYDRCRREFGPVHEWETVWNGELP